MAESVMSGSTMTEGAMTESTGSESIMTEDTVESLPSNVHVSRHPCLRVKLSQLRSKSTNAREVKSLIHEITLILGTEALLNTITAVDGPLDTSALGYRYNSQHTSPSLISLVPILRSGLSMTDALQTLLPSPVPVHHLGLFREPSSLQPVEYYNNLPYHRATATNPHPERPSLAILLDPIIATGGTSVAAIQTLREWGVEKVLLLAVLGNDEGVRRAAAEWPEGVKIWVGGIDEKVDNRGMIMPGLGDVGDRLFLTIGK